MPTGVIQLDGNAANGFTTGDSGVTAGDTTASCALDQTGTGSGTDTVDVGNFASATERAIYLGELPSSAIPDTDWSGDYTIRLQLAAAQASQLWTRVYLMERTSGGTYTTFASLTGQSVDMSTTGLKTFPTITAGAHTAASDSSLCVLIVGSSAKEHGGSAWDLTPSATWTIPMESGAVTLTPSPVTAGFGVAAPAVALGGVTVSPTPVSAAASVPAPSVQLGGLTLAAAAMAAAFGIVSPTIQPGGLTVSPTPVAAAFGVAAPSIQAGTTAEADFKVQAGRVTIPNGSSSVTIDAGTDFDAISSWTKGFIRITNTRHSGMGVASTLNDLPQDFTVWMTSTATTFAESLESGGDVSFNRDGTGGDCEVSWEIVEYIGADGGANEIEILHSSVNTVNSGLRQTGPVTGVTDANQPEVLLLMAAQANRATSTNDIDETLHTLSWNQQGTDDWDVDIETGGSTSAQGLVTWYAIHFKGSNWKDVQWQEFTGTGTTWAPADSNDWNQAFGSSLTAADSAFLHVQYRVTATAGVDDAGDAVGVDSTSNMRIKNRSTNNTRTKVVQVVENTETDSDLKMIVQHHEYADDTAGSNTVRQWTQSVNAVRALDETSPFYSVSMDGSGTGWPAGFIDYWMAGTAGSPLITFREAVDGQERRFEGQIVQWPRSASGDATLTPSPVTAAFGIAAPTVSPGALTVSPAAVAAALGVADPAVQATLTISPAALTAAFGVAGPQLVPGGVTLSPAPTTAAFGLADPTVQVGGLTLSPSALAAAFGVADPTLDTGTSVTPGPVSAAFGVAAPVVTAGAVTLSPAAVAAAFGVSDPTVAPGGLTLSPAAVAAAFGVAAPSLIVGGVTLSPAAIAAAFGIVDPQVTGSGVLSPAAVAAAFAVADPSITLGGVTLSPSAVSAAFGVITPSLTGAGTLSPSAVAASFAVADPALTTGGVTLSPTAVAAAFGVSDPTLVPGGVTLSPSSIAAAFGVADPTVDLGTVTLTPLPAAALFVVTAPGVTAGGATLAPSPVVAVFIVVEPTVTGAFVPSPLRTFLVEPGARTMTVSRDLYLVEPEDRT